MKLTQLFESSLASELRWYIEFVEHFEPQIEFELVDNFLCPYYEGELVGKWSASVANSFHTELTGLINNSPYNAYNFCKHRYKTSYFRFAQILLEPIIARSSTWARWYGQLTGRFEMGEPAIATNSDDSMEYARSVLKSRFPLGEKAIATNALNSYLYAMCIGDPFPLGEKAIAKSPKRSYMYAQNVLKGRFPLGEKAIARSATYSVEYEKFVNSL